MSRYREREYLDRGQSFHYQDHRTDGHDWRGSDSYYNSRNHLDTRDHHLQGGYNDIPSYIDGGYPRGHVPQQPNNEFIPSSFQHDITRDSVFSRLDNNMKRLEGTLDHHSLDPAPLFRPIDIDRHFDHISHHEPLPPTHNNPQPQWANVIDCSLNVDSRESLFRHQLPSSNHFSSDNANQYPPNLLQESHRHRNYSSPHYEQNQYESFRHHDNMPHPQAPARDLEPLFRPSELVNQHYDPQPQISVPPLSPLKPLFSGSSSLLERSSPVSLVDTLIRRGSPPRSSLFPLRELSPPPLVNRSSPTFRDTLITRGSPHHSPSPYLMRDRSPSPLRGSPSPASQFRDRTSPRERSPSLKERSPLPRERSPRARSHLRDTSDQSYHAQSPPRRTSPPRSSRRRTDKGSSRSSRRHSPARRGTSSPSYRGTSPSSHRGTSPTSYRGSSRHSNSRRSPSRSKPSSSSYRAHSPHGRSSRSQKRSPYTEEHIEDHYEKKSYRSIQQSHTTRSSRIEPDSHSEFSSNDHNHAPVITTNPPITTVYDSSTCTTTEPVPKYSEVDDRLIEQVAHLIPKEGMGNESHSSIENKQRLENLTQWLQTAVQDLSDNLNNQSHDQPRNTMINADNEDGESTCSSTLGLKIVVPEELPHDTPELNNGLDALFECDSRHEDEEKGVVDSMLADRTLTEDSMKCESIHSDSIKSVKTECIEISDVEDSDESGEGLKPETKGESEMTKFPGFKPEIPDSKRIENTVNNPACKVEAPSVAMTTEKVRPESPESGEILDSEEEGEITDDSLDEKEPNIKSISPSKDDHRHSISPFLSRFIRRRYINTTPPPRTFNRQKENNERRPPPPRRHKNYKSPRRRPDRRKRRYSSPKKQKDDEKELLLLRTAALETMIVRPKHSSNETSPHKGSQNEQNTPTKPEPDEDEEINVVDVSPVGPGMVNVPTVGPGIVNLSPVGPGIVNLSPVGPGIVNLSPVGPGIVNVSPVRPGVVDMSSVGSSNIVVEDPPMAVDMELVTSGSEPSVTSRDHTPEVTVIPSIMAPTDNVTVPLNTAAVSDTIPPRRNSSCVKVITNNNSTWKVSDFNIMVSDDEEEEHTDGVQDSCENGIGDVIQLYRQVAEAKMSNVSLSSLKVELQECEEEMEQEELKLDLLEQQLKASQQKIMKLKEQKLEIERKMLLTSKVVEPKVPVISVDPAPSTDATPTSTVTSATPTNTVVSDPVTHPTDTLSCPSSTLTSRSSSPFRDGSSPVPNPENETNNSTVLPPGSVSSKPSSLTTTSSSVTMATGKADKHKQLINLVAARQNNLAQVKGLLSIIERNQRKRRRSPNVTQSVGEKITKHSLTTFVNSAKNVKQANQTKPKNSSDPSKENQTDASNPTLTSKQESILVSKPPPTFVSKSAVSKHNPIKKPAKGSHKSGIKAKVGSPSEHTTNPSSSTVSKTTNRSNIHSPAKKKQKKKPPPLEEILKELELKSFEEGKIMEWFDHITSSSFSSGISMPHLICPLSPVSIAINFFSNTPTTNKTDESAAPSTVIRKVLTKPSKTQPSLSIVKAQPSLVGYESALLKFRSYRLSPLYRTLFKQPLSSLTHSNTINPNLIMCHHESQGQCKDKACKAQHFADVIMTHEDIINDITRYAPTEKVVSIREKLSKFSKLENNQLQTMTAHVVSQELSHDDHVTISSHWQQNKLATKPTKPTNHQTPKQLNDLVPFKDMFEETPPISTSDFHDADRFRYFLSETTPSSNTSPSNLITSVRQCTDDERAYTMIEQGLELFPQNETLWIEYLQRANRLKKSTDELFTRAVESVPTYNMYKEVIKLAAVKSKWILIALKHFLANEVHVSDETISHIVLELVLSYCYLNIMQTESLDFLLNFADEISEESVMKKLTIKDKVFLALVHLYVLYTGTLPISATGFHGNTVPITIANTNSFLIPFSDHKLSQDASDDMMSLFRRYLKNFTDSSIELSINILNCLPLYINLFYFEISQGNSSSTIVSIDRLLNTVPDTRELIVMKAYLDDSSTTPMKGADPLVYYIKARKCLLKNNGIDEAVKLLSDCIHGYYTIPDDDVDQYDTCMLYRKLLHFQVPYDAHLPPIDAQQNILSDCPSLCLNYCLLVELTAPVQCTEVFETSLYCNSSIMWLQYVQFLAHLFSNNRTVKNAEQLLEVCQRFTLSLRTYTSSSTLHHQQDYSQMLHELLKCVELPEDKVLLLKHVPIHDNPTWVYMFCQFSECLEQVRSVLARYLTKFPHHVDMWLIGISIEMRLGNYRQARWMFNRAIQYIPYSSNLWTQFLLFELAGIVKQYSIPPLIIQGIVQKLNKFEEEFKSSVLNSIQSIIN